MDMVKSAIVKEEMVEVKIIIAHTTNAPAMDMVKRAFAKKKTDKVKTVMAQVVSAPETDMVKSATAKEETDKMKTAIAQVVGALAMDMKNAIAKEEADKVKTAIAQMVSAPEMNMVKSATDKEKTDKMQTAIAQTVKAQAVDTLEGVIVKVVSAQETVHTPARAIWDIVKDSMREMGPKLPPCGAMTTIAAIPPTGEKAGTVWSGANGNVALMETATVIIATRRITIPEPDKEAGKKPCIGERMDGTT